MTETALYILLSLGEPRHGYGISKYVAELTDDRIKLGSGTIYGTLTKMQKDGLIDIYDNTDKRTVYERTDIGSEILDREVHRIESVYDNIRHVRTGASS
ncbi:MAG: PadR family transcriptional regulator [Oscillospiraceae bacterium]|nr:PadR family transcriptional regulator [Oscillospiraceae bacterium]